MPCPICSKPDWCLIARDGKSARCPRTPNDRWRGGGYEYKLRKAVDVSDAKLEPLRLALDSKVVAELIQMGQKDVTHTAVNALARSLNVPLWTLGALGIGYDVRKGWWFFPMYDDQRQPVGLRYRTADGRKYSLKGGREGLFLSNMRVDSDVVLITEGATDTAAALSLGFRAIGRPSCNGSLSFIERITRDEDPTKLVILSDADTPGTLGAIRVRDTIGGVVVQPRDYKDIRELVAKCPTPLKVIREDLLIAKRTESDYGPWLVIP